MRVMSEIQENFPLPLFQSNYVILIDCGYFNRGKRCGDICRNKVTNCQITISICIGMNIKITQP